MTTIERAQAKRQRRAQRKNPSNYAVFNVTEEAESYRQEFNRQVQEKRDARAAARAQQASGQGEPEHSHEVDNQISEESCEHDHF